MTQAANATNAIVLGAGAAGLLHALALRARGVNIAAVYDPDGARARALADLTGARVLDAWTNAVDDEASVVCVCGPPVVHAAQTMALARPGRRVLVEKPIAVDARELDALVDLPGCYAVLQWRFGRALRAVRAAIARGEFGRTPTVNVDLAWRRDDAYFEAGRGSRAAWGAGALLSIGVHAVDATLFALGDYVTRSSACFARDESGRGRELDTRVALWMQTSRGALVSLRLTLDASHDRTRIAFAGNGACAEIEGGEADPTASRVHWSASTESARRRLALLEEHACGNLEGPLVVPLVAKALSSSDVRYGDGDRTCAPTLRDAAPAHHAIFDVIARDMT